MSQKLFVPTVTYLFLVLSLLNDDAKWHNVSVKFNNRSDSPRNGRVMTLWFWKKKYCQILTTLKFDHFNAVNTTLGQKACNVTHHMIFVIYWHLLILTLTFQPIFLIFKLWPWCMLTFLLLTVNGVTCWPWRWPTDLLSLLQATSIKLEIFLHNCFHNRTVAFANVHFDLLFPIINLGPYNWHTFLGF